MRAAVVQALGQEPVVAEVEEPTVAPGTELADVVLAGLNPIDLHFASGRYGSPPTPHVVGREGIARLAGGGRAYFAAAPFPSGSIAERVALDPATVYDVPDGLDDGLAVALGAAGLAAWLSLTAQAGLQQGESVLVLGASGAVGQLAVQAARILGASRVVAAARDVAALDGSPADAKVALGDGAAAALADAAGGGFDVVVDPVGGEPLAAAVGATAFGARLVTLGVSAGPTAPIDTRALQGRRLIGHSARFFDHDAKRAAFAAMAGHALAGELTIDVEHFPLDAIASAWQAQAESPHRKLVIDLPGAH